MCIRDRGLTEDDAILNARLAKILTIDDYDTEKQQVRLWTPRTDYSVDYGARSQNESPKG